MNAAAKIAERDFENGILFYLAKLRANIEDGTYRLTNGHISTGLGEPISIGINGRKFAHHVTLSIEFEIMASAQLRETLQGQRE